MAFWDDFTLDRQTGDIRHASGTTNYTVIQLHRALAELADDASYTGNDEHDITDPTASDRSTDQIITLNSPYNIDDTAAEYLYGGSISQLGGDQVYYGLKVLGAVNSSSTQIQVLQDGALYDGASPFWGTQSGGGYNGSTTDGVLMRILVKGRTGGADIDGKRIRVRIAHWGDSYDFFNVTLAAGESVAAVSSTPDAQNNTASGTVGAYTHVTNTEGFQLINLNNGNGNREYYSKWTYGANTAGDELKSVWEWTKYITRIGSASTIHGINGQFFLGITHSFAYDGESGGPFVEDEVIAWGTSFAYDNESGGPFTEGEHVTIGSNGASGKLVYLLDSGATGTMYIQKDDTSIAIADNDVVTGITSGATCLVNGARTGDSSNGGTGLLLALDDDGSTGNMYIQLLSGSAPADNQAIIGRASDATCAVNGTPTARTVPKTFTGSYTGTYIGAYGVGIDDGDLTASDTIQDLSATNQTPPNNVTFTVGGLVSGDRVLVTNDDTSAIDYNQFTLNGALTGAAVTSVVVNGSIPADTPTTGKIRITRADGQRTSHAYTSWSGSTFTIGSTDFSSNNASNGANTFLTYIDETASGATVSFTTVYSSDRTLFVRVRDGGATPIKPFETTGTLSSTGGSATAIRNSDS